MSERGSMGPRPVWMKQAEEAKLKSEAEKAAAAKAAFEATFKDVQKAAEDEEPASSDSELEESESLKNKPLGPIDPAKCTAAGTGIAGGAACSPCTFTVIAKDSDSRKLNSGSAQIKVRISPEASVGGSDQEGVVKDHGDGTYTVTYVVAKRGNYMVNVECNGKPIMGSPFPVFFSAGAPSTAGVLAPFPTTSPYPNLVNQTMPNMPNYSGSVSGAFPGLLGMIPGTIPGASGGAILPGIGASLGEICREYMNGRCAKTDCKLNHPPHNLLMAAITATTTLGTVSHAPMAPSAAAMAAAQAIVAAQALQAHAAQVQAQAQASRNASGSSSKEGMGDSLKRTVQVSNLTPHLTVEQLKQLFSYCGTVLECTIADSKHFAYIEYLKPEEATAALALNNMDISGRPLNVEMAKSLPTKANAVNPSTQQSPLSLMMQQAVAVQQMQFQNALIMQQTLASQHAANKAATVKSAAEIASARAAEISKMLKVDGGGDVDDEKESNEQKRLDSSPQPRLKSRSRSPIRYRSSRRSRSVSPLRKSSRDWRSRSPVRSRQHHVSYGYERRSYRDDTSSYTRSKRREIDRSRDHYSYASRRNRSRSKTPRRRSSHAGSRSPRYREHSRLSPRHASKKSSSSHRHSRSPRRASKKSPSPHRHSKSPSTETNKHSRGDYDRSKKERKDDLQFHKTDAVKRKSADVDSRVSRDDKNAHRTARGGRDSGYSSPEGEDHDDKEPCRGRHSTPEDSELEDNRVIKLAKSGIVNHKSSKAGKIVKDQLAENDLSNFSESILDIVRDKEVSVSRGDTSPNNGPLDHRRCPAPVSDEDVHSTKADCTNSSQKLESDLRKSNISSESVDGKLFDEEDLHERTSDKTQTTKKTEAECFAFTETSPIVGEQCSGGKDYGHLTGNDADGPLNLDCASNFVAEECPEVIKGDDKGELHRNASSVSNRNCLASTEANVLMVPSPKDEEDSSMLKHQTTKSFDSYERSKTDIKEYDGDNETVTDGPHDLGGPAEPRDDKPNSDIRVDDKMELDYSGTIIEGSVGVRAEKKKSHRSKAHHKDPPERRREKFSDGRIDEDEDLWNNDKKTRGYDREKSKSGVKDRSRDDYEASRGRADKSRDSKDERKRSHRHAYYASEPNKPAGALSDERVVDDYPRESRDGRSKSHKRTHDKSRLDGHESKSSSNLEYTVKDIFEEHSTHSIEDRYLSRRGDRDKSKTDDRHREHRKSSSAAKEHSRYSVDGRSDPRDANESSSRSRKTSSLAVEDGYDPDQGMNAEKPKRLKLESTNLVESATFKSIDESCTDSPVLDPSVHMHGVSPGHDYDPKSHGGKQSSSY